MEGWLEDLLGVGEKVEGMLMRHARAVQGKDEQGRKTVYYMKR
jgi:hypothetical protein